MTESDSGLRLADLVAAFSLATDLGWASRWSMCSLLGDRISVGRAPRGQRRRSSGALYYAVTLAWVGCVADTPEVAASSATTSRSEATSYHVDFAGLPMLGFMLRHVGAGNPALHRLRLGCEHHGHRRQGRRARTPVALSDHRFDGRAARSRRPDVRQPLQQVFTRWDGKGVPGGIGGEDIALPMRLFHLADTVEVHHRTNGLEKRLRSPGLAAANISTRRSWTSSAGSPAEVLGDPPTSPTGTPS